VCTFVVAVTNLFVAVLYRDQTRESILLAAIAALSLLVLGDFLVDQKDAKFSARLMHSFGIGFNHPVTLLVNNDARPILQGLGVEFAESILTQDSKEIVVLKVKDVEILSRLGSDYFLRFDQRLSFPLKKDKVISWVSEEPKPPDAVGLSGLTK
jgi:hypothetical protein